MLWCQAFDVSISLDSESDMELTSYRRFARLPPGLLTGYTLTHLGAYNSNHSSLFWALDSVQSEWKITCFPELRLSLPRCLKITVSRISLIHCTKHFSIIKAKNAPGNPCLILRWLWQAIWLALWYFPSRGLLRKSHCATFKEDKLHKFCSSSSSILIPLILKPLSISRGDFSASRKSNEANPE